MAVSNKRLKRKPAEFRENNEEGYFGVYYAVVRDTSDFQKMGRIRAWVPDLGGTNDNPYDDKYWKTFSYMTPFGGKSPSDPRLLGQDWPTTATSYGFVAVPPDIGNTIVVAFLGGDSNFGVWMGCLYETHMNHSVPDVAAGKSKGDTQGLVDYVPVTEHSKHETHNDHSRPEHIERTSILLENGLITDGIRGTTTSSMQRESPSQVYGWSTPGPIGEGGYRHGGHAFVMDDGARDGSSRLVRLRTRAGHQLLMHDTAGIIYIANRNGTAWIEMDSQGRILLYSAGGLSMRTEGNLDLHADKDLNIGVDGNFNLEVQRGSKLVYHGGVEETVGSLPYTPDGIVANLLLGNGDKIVNVRGNHVVNTGGGQTMGAGGKISITSLGVPNPIDQSIFGGVSIRSENPIHSVNISSGSLVNINPIADLDAADTASILDTVIKVGKLGVDAVNLISNFHTDTRSPLETLKRVGVPKYSPVSILPTMEPCTVKGNRPAPSLTNSGQILSEASFQSAQNQANTPGHTGEYGSTDGKKPKVGAISSTAERPLNYEDSTGKWQGTGYNKEEPQYTKLTEQPNVRPANSYSISSYGIAEIKKHEGIRLGKYEDVAGFPTVGVGHLMRPQEIAQNAVQIDGKFVKLPLSPDQVERLLMQDLVQFEKAVKESLGTTRITQNQYDACVSLAFNVGTDGFKGSTVVRRMKAGETRHVPQAFMLWSKATVEGKKQVVRGLVNRREAEVLLFTKLSSPAGASV